MIEDIFVDVDEIVDAPASDFADDFVDNVDSDEFIDVDEIIGCDEYVHNDDKPVKKTYRYDAYGRCINKPSDYVSFRYSRQDRDEGHEIIPNPVMERFRYFQSEIKKISVAKMPLHVKKKKVHSLRSEFAQELRIANIRYRNLWRHLDTFGILPKMHW